MERGSAPYRGGCPLTSDPQQPRTPRLRSVNVARPTPDPTGSGGTTGIRKSPTSDPVTVRDPGPRSDGRGGGIPVDHIGDHRHHGGADQALYAVAAEELAWWSTHLGRELPDGRFGENLTTVDLDVDTALVGEIWVVGTARLQVSGPRIPCATFAAVMAEPRWVRRFTERGRTGAYLRVAAPGVLRAGDQIEVEARPDHGVTVSRVFRALTTQRELLPSLLAAEPDLSTEARAAVADWQRRQ